jgi:hypothetical protein
MQSFSMSLQITFQSATLTTITLERFLSSVQSNVSLQTDVPSERLPTDPKHKAIFTTLYHKMSHKVPSDSESLLKCCTCVWFVTSVNPK